MTRVKALALKSKSEYELPMGFLAASIAPDGLSFVAGCMDGVYVASFDETKLAKRICDSWQLREQCE